MTRKPRLWVARQLAKTDAIDARVLAHLEKCDSSRSKTAK